jgi:predicted dehydrogenase
MVHLTKTRAIIRSFAFISAILATTLMATHAKGEEPKVLRAGIIGLDTSHVTAFTKSLNTPGVVDERAQVEVVAAYPGGSDDIASSRDRVAGFTKDVSDRGVEIVDSIDELLTKVDVVLLESVDGRPHLEQAIPVFRAKKLLYIDKPLAGSLVDCLAIKALGEKYQTPWFSSSSLRFSPGTYEYRVSTEKAGRVLGAVAWSPCSIEPTHPDLYWYGVHGMETLYTLMGRGCQQVSRVHTEGTDSVTGKWSDGRIGTFIGMRAGKPGYGATIFAEKGIFQAGPYAGYEPLVMEIAKFFVTGTVPIKPEETIEMFAFMTAADVSKQRGGAPVTIEEVMNEAQSQVTARLAEFGESISE